ncbi:MAG: UMP kinase [Nitrososphaerota archaeon]
MKKIVIKISGSLFYWERVEADLPLVAQVIKGVYHPQNYRIFLVAGGGETARRYISVGRALGGNEGLLDDMGLRSARLNAELVIASLGDIAYPVVPEGLDDVIKASETNKVVVVGGLHPGHSTNAVAALIGERVNADLFINTTDVEGVYTSDPNKDKNAKLLERVTIADLRRMFGDSRMLAGTYELMDLVAINVIERSRLKTVIVKCTPQILHDAILGNRVGTEVVI